MAIYIRRREFISTLCGAAIAWPLAARAQQPAMPVIGYLNSATPEGSRVICLPFARGSKRAATLRARMSRSNRWAENQPERLRELAADLVRRQVKVIAAMGALASIAAGRATATIPIVFGVPE